VQADGQLTRINQSGKQQGCLQTFLQKQRDISK